MKSIEIIRIHQWPSYGLAGSNKSCWVRRAERPRISAGTSWYHTSGHSRSG
jgi:hypothetical protein